MYKFFAFFVNLSIYFWMKNNYFPFKYKNVWSNHDHILRMKKLKKSVIFSRETHRFSPKKSCVRKIYGNSDENRLFYEFFKEKISNFRGKFYFITFWVFASPPPPPNGAIWMALHRCSAAASWATGARPQAASPPAHYRPSLRICLKRNSEAPKGRGWGCRRTG